MKIEEYENGIVIRDTVDFDLKDIFECGQCFRWNEDTDGSYIGVISGKPVRVYKTLNDIYIKGASIADKDFFNFYFDLDRDYGKIKEELKSDSVLKEAIKHAEGIRILSQDMFEIVISFIISSNNRIFMIKRTVENISRMYGSKVAFEGRDYYSFPTPDELAKADLNGLKQCGCGFRAPYVKDTAEVIAKGNVSLEKIREMDTDDAAKELMELKGIGPKVADCILLFSMQKYDAFPVDVWIKRIMQYFYLAPDVSLKKIREFARNKFGNFAGFSQEYLFYYARDTIKKEGFEK